MLLTQGGNYFGKNWKNSQLFAVSLCATAFLQQIATNLNGALSCEVIGEKGYNLAPTYSSTSYYEKRFIGSVPGATI